MDHLRLLRDEVRIPNQARSENAGTGRCGAMDVCRGRQYLRAKAAGVPGARIVFSGVGKTVSEIRARPRRRHSGSSRRISNREAVLDAVAALYEQGRADPTIRVNPMSTLKTQPRMATGQVREQVRHPHRPRARVYRMAAAICQGWRSWHRLCTSASQLTDLGRHSNWRTRRLAELTETKLRGPTAIPSAGSGFGRGSGGIPYER